MNIKLGQLLIMKHSVGGYSLDGVPIPRSSGTSDGSKKAGLLKRLWGDFGSMQISLQLISC